MNPIVQTLEYHNAPAASSMGTRSDTATKHMPVSNAAGIIIPACVPNRGTPQPNALYAEAPTRPTIKVANIITTSFWAIIHAD